MMPMLRREAPPFFFWGGLRCVPPPEAPGDGDRQPLNVDTSKTQNSSVVRLLAVYLGWTTNQCTEWVAYMVVCALGI